MRLTKNGWFTGRNCPRSSSCLRYNKKEVIDENFQLRSSPKNRHGLWNRNKKSFRRLLSMKRAAAFCFLFFFSILTSPGFTWGPPIKYSTGASVQRHSVKVCKEVSSADIKSSQAGQGSLQTSGNIHHSKADKSKTFNTEHVSNPASDPLAVKPAPVSNQKDTVSF